MNIHDDIKKVRDYFVAKMVSGEFEAVKYNDAHLTIEIDGLYRFCLWLGIKTDFFSLYSIMDNFMLFELTQEEKDSIRPLIMAEHKKMFEEKIKQEKIEQLNKLKKELGYE